MVRVVRFFSKVLVGAPLNWSAREKEYYEVYYLVKLFEAELDGRYFILATDHVHLTYINTVLTGKVLRWKLYLLDRNWKSKRNSSSMLYRGFAKTACLRR